MTTIVRRLVSPAQLDTDSERPILVTGAPRSGTSWVGRLLAEAPRVRYIHEPFNISAPPCRCGLKLDYWFYYATARDVALRNHLQHLLSSPFHPINAANALEAAVSPRRHREGLRKLKNIGLSITTSRTVVKDPLALFSAEWLATQFNMLPVVLIRHPAAVVSSYKTLNWNHKFTHFLHQPQLLDECLPSFIDEIEEFSQEAHNLIDEVSLLWRLIYFQVHRYQTIHPEWMFVRYEDLTRDPVSGFAELFQGTNLRLTHSVQIKIERSRSIPPESESSDPYSSKRDSLTTAEKWRHLLTPEEVEHIRHNVEDVSKFFYSDDEW